MGKSRGEAFSDGVIAIIITLMVLELRVPHGESLHDLVPVIPPFLSDVLSFVDIGITWNNHHHRLHALQTVTGPILWTNLHLLFWLSLIPFATDWMGENHFAASPSGLYGVVLFMASVAYQILQQQIIASQGPTVPFEEGRRKRLEGSAVVRALSPRHSIGIFVALDLPGSVWTGGAVLACSGSAH